MDDENERRVTRDEKGKRLEMMSLREARNVGEAQYVPETKSIVVALYSTVGGIPVVSNPPRTEYTGPGKETRTYPEMEADARDICKACLAARVNLDLAVFEVTEYERRTIMESSRSKAHEIVNGALVRFHGLRVQVAAKPVLLTVRRDGPYWEREHIE